VFEEEDGVVTPPTHELIGHLVEFMQGLDHTIDELRDQRRKVKKLSGDLVLMILHADAFGCESE
jgi:hypothetical protein